ncbi:TlpA family protein disulfide reductase [Pinibacter soli]|uniref:Redoxin family protein n=1 Tax=Pinibacter soli TaxID=3044211 RepID=A0ABT6RDC7_9BACT|nr:redoxin family protein [Pinibacter soli]MDI3320584.1 redoxin family protein [Pinibacter soli]
MKKYLKPLLLCVLFLLLFFFGRSLYLSKTNNQPSQPASEAILKHVGEKFDPSIFTDIEGHKTTLQPTTPITIVDFWFKDCPPCINEMNQFDNLLKQNDNSKKISIVSVSVNSYPVWRDLFKSENPRFASLKIKNSNWQHLTLTSAIDTALHNEVPSDNLALMERKFNSHTFPTYVVIDKEFNIIAMPQSAVEYIQSNAGAKK